MSLLSRYTTILGLGLPIIGGMLSQSVLNLVDAALVGRLGEVALAGVGIGSYANFVAISLILGLSSGVQAIVARRRGEGQMEHAARPVHWGMTVAILFALPLSLLLIQLSDPIVATMSDQEDVLAIASKYFDYRTAAMLPIAFLLCFRGWWNGTGRPVVFFKMLIFTHILNVALSYSLIFGEFGMPEMGAPGAGLGTAIALTIGCVLNLIIVYRDARPHGFLQVDLSRAATIGNLLRLSIPHSLQQFFLAMAICMLFWIIGQLGTDDQAIAHVLINLSLFLILPGVGFGVASTSLVSHAIGEGKINEACEWGWRVIKTALAFIFTLSLPLWLIPDLVLSIFLNTEQLIDEARLPLQLTALAICVDAAAIVLTQALLGAGANKTVLAITTTGQWCFYLPLAWLFGPYLGFGLMGIWVVQVFYRAFSSLVFIRVWTQQKWLHIRI